MLDSSRFRAGAHANARARLVKEVFMSLALSFAAAMRRLAVAAALMAGMGLAAGAEPLVSVEWLKQHRSDADLVVLDIRSVIDGGGAQAYAAGHIPGAVHSDYDKDGWRVTRNGIPFMLPDTAQIELLLGDLGIDEESRVVVVPAGVHVLDFGAAARVYWTLKMAGHQRVSILDGGFAAWKADPANPIEAGINGRTPKIFSVERDDTVIARAEDVERASRSRNATLLDARPARFFTGKEKAPAAKAYGHIPGARNLDSAAFYDQSRNRLRPLPELAAIAAAIPAGPVVSYCNTGHWAATNWFVLSELLGRKEVKLYPGSMIEWTADAHRPVESERTRWDDLKKVVGLGL
jgi:thiosulfate/3-mercaptopyruvate sulfurtransferase